MEGYHPSTYGDRWADVYDDWYGDDGQVEPTVAFLTELAGPPARAGVLLELGIGTGRIALPLAARGYDVRGIDASAAMVDVLRAKPGGAELPVVVGDMAAVEVPARAGDPASVAAGPLGGVFVAYNTFFALATEADQRACLARIAQRLRPDGWFATGMFVPADHLRTESGRDVGLRSLEADRVVLTADIHDAAEQTISGQFIEITAAGTVLRPFHLRYLFPAQLDELAADAGLERRARFASWAREPFDDDSRSHVTVYGLAR